MCFLKYGGGIPKNICKKSPAHQVTARFQAYRKFGYEHGAAHIIIQMENTWLDSLLPMAIKLQVMDGPALVFPDD